MTEQSKKYLSLLLILGSISAFGPLSIDMYLPAFPMISREFGVDLSKVELTLAAFFAGLAIGQIFYGPLTDRFGRKKPLYVGLTIYLISSYFCANVQSIEALIIFRFLQAMGSCAGMVISRAIVRDMFHPQDSAKVFSTLMLIMGVAPILAPLVGGFITLHLSWRWLFWLLVILSSVVLLAIARFLPETKQSDPSYQMKNVFRTYTNILKDRKFIGYAASGGCAMAGMFAYITGSPFVFIDYFKIPAQYYGLIFGTNAFALIAFSQLNSKLIQRNELDKILKAVFTIIFFISIILVIVGWSSTHFLFVAIPLFFYLGMLGIIFPTATAQALATQGRNAGSASALVGTVQFSLACLSAGLVSLFHATTPMTMTGVMAFFGISSFAVYNLAIGKRPSSE